MAMRPPPLHLGQVFDSARTNLQDDKLYTFFALIVNSLYTSLRYCCWVLQVAHFSATGSTF